MKIYTKKGDDGTTGLFYGGRVRKDSDQPSVYGVVDEAQAILGVARVEAERGSELDEMLVSLERDMYVLMAELATAPENRGQAHAGAVEREPGHGRSARAAHRRPDDAVRAAQGVRAPRSEPGSLRTSTSAAPSCAAPSEPLSAAPPPSLVVPYLNRLSDLLWTMARWQEGEALPAKST